MNVMHQDFASALDNAAEATKNNEKPSISVIGLGYVGAVSCACLAHLGFHMTGVDVSLEKVRTVKEGRSPIVEDRLEELLSEGVRLGRMVGSGDFSS